MTTPSSLLTSDDYCGLITQGGELKGLFTHNIEEFWSNADEIQEIMLYLMKESHFRETPYFWRIKKDKQTIQGYSLIEDSNAT